MANGFLDVPGVKVFVLYPQGKVSEIQEKQFTTLGRNITALEVSGTFDDCQALVKNAFMDKELNEKLYLTTANSINVARFLPQSFYYFYVTEPLLLIEQKVLERVEADRQRILCFSPCIKTCSFSGTGIVSPIADSTVSRNLAGCGGALHGSVTRLFQ